MYISPFYHCIRVCTSERECFVVLCFRERNKKKKKTISPGNRVVVTSQHCINRHSGGVTRRRVSCVGLVVAASNSRKLFFRRIKHYNHK